MFLSEGIFCDGGGEPGVGGVAGEGCPPPGGLRTASPTRLKTKD